MGLVLLSGALGALGGCAELPYYWQSVQGHWALLRAAQPVQQWIDDPQTAPALRAQLERAQRIRRFAVSDMALPDNASYGRYADLHRPAVVWNVVAAPAWSLTLKTWCFPVMGCVGYRGYFDAAEAHALAGALEREGWEVSVYGVPAYSTLGRLNALGGDPLLSTFITYPEGELARMIFHELAHQVVYVGDDTAFNESFATAVERLGSAQWLAGHATAQVRADFALREQQREQFRDLLRQTREELESLYRQVAAQTLAQPDAAREKQRVWERLRLRYAQRKANGSTSPAAPSDSYDRWIANANNASLGTQAAYDRLVPAFERLYLQSAEGTPPAAAWQRFYAKVRALTELTPEQRMRALGVAPQPTSAAQP